ncbi:hypothetical protein IKQ65_01560, partial [Candidatus Saccharibacteria bacterium]|nr:hypothetical protein [Candidatus Saccharibacteria bacterium]
DKDKTFQMRNEEELKDYTTLLLNCYIMQEKVDDLKNFIEMEPSPLRLLMVLPLLRPLRKTSSRLRRPSI